jgi:hydrogenase/urease accessory protein HupE
VTLAALALALAAHDEGSSSSELRVAGREAVWTVDVGTLGLAKVIRIEERPDQLTERKVQALKPDIARLILGGVSLHLNGQEAAPEIGTLEPVYEEIPPSDVRSLSRVRLELRYRSAEEIRTVQAGVRLFADLTPRHSAVLTVRWNDRTREVVIIGPGERRFRYETLDERGWAGPVQFVKWGVHHIFIGYDHIAFLLALLLGTPRLRDLVKTVTAFTVAHSLTLLLAALHVVRLPGALTEALIAASIIYVAVENFWIREGRHRWLLVFGFGLIHGLGFSSSLRELLTDRVVVPVLAFNVGVELGQIAILAAAAPAVAWLGRARDPSVEDRRRRRLAWAGSVPLLLLGVFWLAERALGLTLMA